MVGSPLSDDALDRIEDDVLNQGWLRSEDMLRLIEEARLWRVLDSTGAAGSILRGIREEAGVEQIGLAAKAGISCSGLCRIELNYNGTTIERLRKLFGLLGYSMQIRVAPTGVKGD